MYSDTSSHSLTWYPGRASQANDAMTKDGALVSMSPAALNLYEGGYAAFHWNADGTCAQGLVPVQYESSADSADTGPVSLSLTVLDHG